MPIRHDNNLRGKSFCFAHGEHCLKPLVIPAPLFEFYVDSYGNYPATLEPHRARANPGNCEADRAVHCPTERRCVAGRITIEHTENITEWLE
jgi:hypothetical protein